MAKVLLITLLCISLSFAITIYQFPSNKLKISIKENAYVQVYKTITRVSSELNIQNTDPVTIYECDNLKEFSDLTGEPYSTGGIYENGFIIIQPFKILKSKNLLVKILTHEILHYVIQQKYKLPLWMEEGYIEYVLNDTPDNLSGEHRHYLIKFLKRIIDEEENIVSIFNNYRR